MLIDNRAGCLRKMGNAPFVTGNYTQGLYHFNNNIFDSAGLNVATVEYGNFAYQPAKFANGIYATEDSAISNIFTQKMIEQYIDVIFTIEFFVMFTANSQSVNLKFGYDGSDFNLMYDLISGSDEISNYQQRYLNTNGNAVYNSINSRGLFTLLNYPYHVAICGRGQLSAINYGTRLFINGVSRSNMSVGLQLAPTSSKNLSITANSNVVIDELRFSRIKRYEDNFTPPSAPFVVD
jgi:hypothetical protein